ncbi:MAG: sugar phosphate isomerase/epimerase [Methanomicrobiaceae archaeon]|nr:sugar phosphate isomerase/epimerase [Methanomicrobiaceae archaeon]
MPNTGSSPVYGCSTYACFNNTLEIALEQIAARTTLAEILSDTTHSLLRNAEVCACFDLRYTVHAPCADMNIACHHERIRKASIEVIDEVAASCNDIGAERLVIHPGYCESVYGSGMERSARALDRSLMDLAELQAEREVIFTIENLGSWDICHFRDPSLLDRLEELGLGFVLDVGHAHINGNLEAFLATSSPVHVHLHDNNGKNDDHAACGSGTIDFQRVFASIPPDATLIIETANIEAFDESIDYLASLARAAKDECSE